MLIHPASWRVWPVSVERRQPCQWRPTYRPQPNTARLIDAAAVLRETQNQLGNWWQTSRSVKWTNINEQFTNENLISTDYCVITVFHISQNQLNVFYTHHVTSTCFCMYLISALRYLPKKPVWKHGFLIAPTCRRCLWEQPFKRRLTNLQLTCVDCISTGSAQWADRQSLYVQPTTHIKFGDVFFYFLWTSCLEQSTIRTVQSYRHLNV